MPVDLVVFCFCAVRITGLLAERRDTRANPSDNTVRQTISRTR